MGYKTRVDSEGRECSECLEYKTWEHYYKWARSSTGYRSACVTCSRERNKQRSLTMLRYYNYGLSEEVYQQLLKHQRGKCAICKVQLSSVKKPSVDHDHSTGEIRGLLCSGCNTGLGQFKDQVSRLKDGINYLLDPPFQNMEKE